MPLQKPQACILSGIVICLLAFGSPARADTKEQEAIERAWRDLGRQMLLRLGTGRAPSAQWFNREWEGVDLSSLDAVRAAKAISAKALDAYGQDVIVVKGRIPLDVDPRSLLGFYAAEWLPSTRLGDWGRRQLRRCIEQACLVAMPGIGSNWHAELEARVLAMDMSLQDNGFAETEAPYLYYYLMANARSVETRRRAGERLARCLWEKYGLECGLKQYLALLGPDYPGDKTWLSGVMRLDRIGPHAQVKRLYECWLAQAGSPEAAQQTVERLIGLLLSESRYREAHTILDQASRRFGPLEWTMPEIRSFLRDFHEDRIQTRQRLAGELVKTMHEPKAWEWCRLLDALWTLEDAAHQWQVLLQDVEPGTPAEQCGRVFLARALLKTDQIGTVENMVRGLAESLNPFIRAQGLALAAEIAYRKGQEADSVRLYSQALQIDRPILLPDWAEDIVQLPSEPTVISGETFQTQLLFLRGCHHLKNGDYAEAVDSLCLAATHLSLPDHQQRVLPCLMLLACLGVEDYAEAHTWVYRGLQEYQKTHPDDGRVGTLLTTIYALDLDMLQLITLAREEAAGHPAASSVWEQAIAVCEAGMSIASCEPLAETTARALQWLSLQTCRHYSARILTAEYHYVRQQTIQQENIQPAVSVEPLLFAASILRGDSPERIQEGFAALAEDRVVPDRMHRFATFAMQAGQVDLAASILDVRISKQMSSADAALLDNIANHYLTVSQPQKAIDILQKIAAGSRDPNRAQAICLEVINIYAENMKDYDKAIRQCEEFLRKYPDSLQVVQLDFRIGKLAYLKKDYAGAAAQMIAFQKKYPEHPHIGEAMLLTGLSRMAEGYTLEAINRFAEIIRKFPDHDLAARSKFLIGYAQVSEQRYPEALETFQQMIEQFPQSPYVPQAQSLIDRLGKVSR